MGCFWFSRLRLSSTRLTTRGFKENNKAQRFDANFVRECNNFGGVFRYARPRAIDRNHTAVFSAVYRFDTNAARRFMKFSTSDVTRDRNACEQKKLYNYQFFFEGEKCHALLLLLCYCCCKRSAFCLRSRVLPSQDARRSKTFMVNRINLSWSFLFLLSSCVGSAAFHAPISHRPRVFLSIIASTPYGRGAEIWPECNEEPVLLADSFPGGFIPDIAQDELQASRNYEPEVVVETPKRRRPVPRAIQRILRRAAVKEEDAEYNRMRVDKAPAVIALSLLVGGLVQPVDVLVVAFLSGYLSILSTVSRSMRSDGVTPILPSLPPQGHVPALVSNPLGNAFTNSDGYDLWLKFGTSVSVVAPIALLGRYLLFQNKQAELAKYCARPVFLLCCQAVSESISRKVMVSCKLCSSCSLILCVCNLILTYSFRLLFPFVF
jgi:hypothetical protein